MQKTASPAVLTTSRTSEAAAQPSKAEQQQRLLAEAEAERQLKAVIIGEPSQHKATSTAEDEESASLSLLHMDGLQPSEAVAFLSFKQGNGAELWRQWSDGMQRYRATRRDCRQRLRSLHSERDAIAALASAVAASSAGLQTADGVEVMDEADYHRLLHLTARKRQWRREEEERRRQEAEQRQQQQSVRQLQLQLCTAFSIWYERWYGAGERERAEQRRREARRQQQQEAEDVKGRKEEKAAVTEQKEAAEQAAAAASSQPVMEEKQSAAGADDAKPGSAQAAVTAVPSSASSLQLSDMPGVASSTTSTQRKVEGSSTRTKTASRSSARP